MKNLQKCGFCLFLALAVLAGANRAAAQGTAFTYQGSLNTNGVPANGFFDFEFSLYPNAEVSGTQIGSTITQTNIGVTNGMFAIVLNFGGVFTGNDTWLAMSVRSNGVGTYTALTPLQELTPTPYAIFANTASNLSGILPAAQLSGTLPLARLPVAVVTNDEGGVTLSNVTVSGNLTLPAPTDVTGIIYAGGNTLVHGDANNNFYAGPGAGSLTNSGTANTGMGVDSLQNNSNGTNNTAIGYDSLQNNTNGSYNTASGERALLQNTSGNDNTADGRHALESNTSGNDNTAQGYEALSANTSGSQNTANGSGALGSLKDGSNNIALGYQAGNNYTGGASSNIDIGNLGVSGDNNIIRIGAGQTSAYIAGVINGDGHGLTNLDAAQLSGAIALAQLPAAVITNDDPNVTFGQLSLGGNLNLPYPATMRAAGGNFLDSDNNNNLFFGSGAGNYATTGGDNTAVGTSALSRVTSGAYNTVIGADGLEANTIGDANTATGFLALENNKTGGNNTVEGADAMAFNISGSYNTAIGTSALENSTNDSELVAVGYQALENDSAFGSPTSDGNGHNTAIGFQALEINTSGYGNTGVGFQALIQNTNGIDNEAIGNKALSANTSGSYNTANGANALENNTTGNQNVAVGYQALGNSTTDYNLVAIGYQALQNDNAFFVDSFGPGTVSGFGENTAIGCSALQADTFGYANTAVGNSTLEFNTTGYENTALGDRTLFSLKSGYQNVAVGYEALFSIQNGASNNIAVGYEAGVNLDSGSSNIYIGNSGFSAESGVIRIGESQSQTYLVGAVNCGTIFGGTIFGTGIVSSDGIDAGGAITAGGNITSVGVMTCCSLTVAGGCDLAEPFPISTAEQQVSEGAVMVIDEKNPGQLKLTDRPYDTRVAGIISGANGVNPGIKMQQQGLIEGGKNVALSGRVYVQADTSNGAIEPGDLLTTSSTPGRAMKVTDHIRAQGAILGKAMSELSEGKGMVLVLVTLQ